MWQSRSDHTFEVLGSADGATWSAPLFTATSQRGQPDGPSAAATDSIVVFIDNEGLGSPVSVVVGS